MNGAASSSYVSIAWASCPRWAVAESADLVAVIEQPAGKSCAVLIDVQGTGAPPRRIGQSLLLEARSLLGGGVSVDLAAHALNQQLHSWRDGQVGAAIVVVSISPIKYRAEIAAYGDITIALSEHSTWTCHQLRSGLAGHDPGVGPDCRVMSLEREAVLIVSSDGLGRTADGLATLVTGLKPGLGTIGTVTALIASAVERDHGRPSADMASIAIQIATDIESVAVERGEVRRRVNNKAARA
jgi:hypothetical protein